MIYLAAPYTHQDKSIQYRRVLACSRYVAERADLEDEIIYSPLVYGHGLEEYAKQVLAYEYWLAHGLVLLHRSTSMRVLQLPGWDKSRGVAAEIEAATLKRIPIDYIPVEERWYSKARRGA